jgi:hypothetical protein
LKFIFNLCIVLLAVDNKFPVAAPFYPVRFILNSSVKVL